MCDPLQTASVMLLGFVGMFRVIGLAPEQKITLYFTIQRVDQGTLHVSMFPQKPDCEAIAQRNYGNNVRQMSAIETPSNSSNHRDRKRRSKIGEPIHWILFGQTNMVFLLCFILISFSSPQSFIEARKKAIQVEKERAATVANLPSLPPNPIEVQFRFRIRAHCDLWSYH